MNVLLPILFILVGLTTWSVYIIEKKVSKMEKQLDDITSKVADALDTTYHRKAHSEPPVN